MKVVLYNGQNKFTVDNISIPGIANVYELVKENKEYTVSASDLQYYNFRITSTRGALAQEEEMFINEDLEREIEEGINWKIESVN